MYRCCLLLSVVRELLFVDCGVSSGVAFVACVGVIKVLLVVWCLLFVVCCLTVLSAVRCWSMCVVRCSLFVVRCLLCVACCKLFVFVWPGCLLVFVNCRCVLFVACSCLLLVVWSVFVRCCLLIAVSNSLRALSCCA